MATASWVVSNPSAFFNSVVHYENAKVNAGLNRKDWNTDMRNDLPLSFYDAVDGYLHSRFSRG